jgi:hypothetical protein
MIALPPSEWRVEYFGGNTLLVAAHINNGALCWTKVTSVSSLENFARSNEGECAVGIDVHRATVGRPCLSVVK